MIVYRKRAKFKGATERDFWYSATRSDGKSVRCIFKCPITTESAAFEIKNAKGNFKVEQKEGKDGIVYENYTYYITSCDFAEIKGEELPL